MRDQCPCIHETSDNLPNPDCKRCNGVGWLGMAGVLKSKDAVCQHPLCPNYVCLPVEYAKIRAKNGA